MKWTARRSNRPNYVFLTIIGSISEKALWEDGLSRSSPHRSVTAISWRIPIARQPGAPKRGNTADGDSCDVVPVWKGKKLEELPGKQGWVVVELNGAVLHSMTVCARPYIRRPQTGFHDPLQVEWSTTAGWRDDGPVRQYCSEYCRRKPACKLFVIK